MRNPFLFVLFICLIPLLAGCDRGFDEATGVYTGNGVTATFPTGWETFSGVPHSVVARRDPASSAKVILTVQDLPGVSMADYLKQRTQNFAAAGMKEIDAGVIEADGLEGRWSIIDQKQQGKPFRAITYIFLTNEKLYTVMGLTETSDFEPWEERFDAIARSVDFE